MSWLKSIVVFALLPLFACCLIDTASDLERNKSIVRRYIEEVVNTGNVDKLPAFISADYVEIYQNTMHPIGPEGAREHVLGVRSAFPDLEVTVEQQIGEGDWVVSRITVRGTHRGEWLGMAPTGKTLEFTGVNIDKVIDGRIVEHGGAANLYAPLLEAGAIRTVDDSTDRTLQTDPDVRSDQPTTRPEAQMKIKLSSIVVDEQDKALKFYTDILGFVKKTDFPVGEFRWLTVVSPQGPEDIELVLEPNAHPAAKTYQEAIYKDGIPATAFAVEDIQQEYERLKKLGVRFTMEPTKTGGPTIAVFDDTCGNLIQLYQE